MISITLERELLDDELWSVRPALKLPINIQLLIEKEQIRQDIWDVSRKLLNSNLRAADTRFIE
ncbi:MAG: hypothetical protein KAF91_09520 [Nostoc sp. TH1S01]|nr:hypothetical protein [Nostoc sp. TH1S01]